VDVRDIGLRQTQRELGQPCRRLEENREHTGGQRVESACVSNSMRAGQAAQAVDDGERGLASAFIDI